MTKTNKETFAELRVNLRYTQDRNFGVLECSLVEMGDRGEWIRAGGWMCLPEGCSERSEAQFRDLVCRVQRDVGNGGFYGFSVEYRDVWSVDLRRIQEMAAMLKRVHRSLERDARDRGETKDAGELLVRFAKAVGADGFLYAGERLDATGMRRLVEDFQKRTVDSGALIA